MDDFTLMPSARQVDQAVGTTIGAYRVRRELGSGGMGQVFLVEHPSQPGVRYALKTLSIDDPAFVQRFQREVAIGRQLSHPNLCAVLDHGVTSSGAPFLVMEYVEGLTLDKVITQRAPMALNHAIPIAFELLSGLEVLHDRNVIHRDLKPANIILKGEGTVKILDFGIARQAGGGRLTATGMTMGSPGFMSPEQVRDTRSVDHRTDLFSVGVIMYAMLTARLPFEGRNMEETFKRLMCGEMTPLEELRPDLERSIIDWTVQLLQPDLDVRFQSAKAARNALLQCVPNTPSAAPPPHGRIAMPESTTEISNPRHM